MKIVIAGAHGKIARQLTRLLVADGHAVAGLVRRDDQRQDLLDDGAEPVVLDLEQSSCDDVSPHLAGADAAVFAAGAGPGSGAARKKTVDLGASVLLADACEAVGVARFVQISTVGVDSVRGGARPEGVDEVMTAYLQAKLAAEEDLRRRSLRWVILRPGRLTDDPGSGRVRLQEAEERGPVPRADVAAVLAEILRTQAAERRVLHLVSGDTPVAQAVAAYAS